MENIEIILCNKCYNKKKINKKKKYRLFIDNLLLKKILISKIHKFDIHIINNIYTYLYDSNLSCKRCNTKCLNNGIIIIYEPYKICYILKFLINPKVKIILFLLFNVLTMILSLYCILINDQTLIIVLIVMLIILIFFLHKIDNIL